MSFQDHFSTVAATYGRYRPTYPEELFRFVARLPASVRTVWDCGTGNGQAAVGVAQFADTVVATDASDAQIRHAQPHPRVHYEVAPAEASGLPAASVDLVMVAQAAHWFDLARFYAEVRRVARPGAAIALWTYHMVSISPEIDALVQWFYTDVVGAYWPPGRQLVDGGYASLPFPFAEVNAPAFESTRPGTLDDVLGYLGTWSAVSRYRAARGEDPVAAVRPAFEDAWGAPETRLFRWAIPMRAGRMGETA
ncbi:MAG: class I SAM-dependent methyltransferase [Bacteroidota bacterium]